MKKVDRVSKTGEYFTIYLEGGETVEAKTVIVGTGSTPKRTGIKGEAELWGRGVSTCATCDGFFYKGKSVAVLGGGDTALEEAHYLSNICAEVNLIHRRDEFRASPATVDRIRRTQNINMITSTIIEEIEGNMMGVTGLKIKDLKTDEVSILEVPGVFIFAGHNVNNSVLKDESGEFICDMNEWGQVIVDLSMRTSVEGLYAMGDMRVEAPKQVVSAAGDGAVAALQVITYIQEMS
jgi:thioredoxin reductase (NADPH)